MASDYDRLVEKVDSLSAVLTVRLRDELACAPGCASCCHVELTVAAVEADAIRRELDRLPEAARRAIAERADEPPTPGGRCVMLDDASLCSIFPSRPLVCRTQGLPLLYPADFVPADAILVSTPRGAITACPLNFRTRTPSLEDAVDAARVDAMLALVDRLEGERSGTPERPRIGMRELAKLPR